MINFRNSLTRFGLAASILVLGACGDSTGPDDDYLGTYALVEVNGQTLPFTIEEDGEQITIVSGSITLLANGRWTEEIDADFLLAGQPAPLRFQLDDGGSYTVTGSTLRLNSDEGFSFNGSVTGGVLTYTVPNVGGPNFVLTFRR